MTKSKKKLCVSTRWSRVRCASSKVDGLTRWRCILVLAGTGTFPFNLVKGEREDIEKGPFNV